MSIKDGIKLYSEELSSLVCPNCKSDFAYQPLIGPPECPNTQCRFYTKRQKDEAVEQKQAVATAVPEREEDQVISWREWIQMGTSSD